MKSRADHNAVAQGGEDELGQGRLASADVQGGEAAKAGVCLGQRLSYEHCPKVTCDMSQVTCDT